MAALNEVMVVFGVRSQEWCEVNIGQQNRCRKKIQYEVSIQPVEEKAFFWAVGMSAGIRSPAAEDMSNKHLVLLFIDSNFWRGNGVSQ